MTRSETSQILRGSSAVLGAALLVHWLARQWGPETRPHVLNERKFVDARPQGLADAAGASLDVYALASAMQSEETSRAGQVAVGWAVRNFCSRRRRGVSDQLLRAVWRGRKQPSHGRFGSSESPGKWASTARAPTAATLLLARAILSSPPGIPDPTGGSEAWDSPELQNRKHAENPEIYTKDAEDVAADRIAAGGEEIKVPGVPRTRFWRFG